jgi:glycosyltransferase involved in cell wall biosynthesis
MRITYLHQYFNTPDMPGSTRSYELARRLVEMGHEVTMVTSWRDDTDKKHWFESSVAGIRVHWLPVPYSNRMGYRQRAQAFMRFAWASAHRAASQPADIIYATSTPLTIALPGAWAARRQKVPMVFEVRDLWPDVPIAMGAVKNKLLISIARCLEKFAYSHATSTVVLTPTMRELIAEKGVPREKISIIPNGADPNIFSAERLTDDSQSTSVDAPDKRQPVLLYCGSLGPAHGPDYLVKLAEEFLAQGKNILIRVAGDGKLKENLLIRAEQTGCLNKTIDFVGSVAKADVPSLYEGADASIMTMADYEILYQHSVQNKFFESLAAGVPVFSNYSGWASEVANTAGAGIILPRDNVSQAAKTVATHIEDPSWLNDAGEAARWLLEERFNFDLLAKKLVEVLMAARTQYSKRTIET